MAFRAPEGPPDALKAVIAPRRPKGANRRGGSIRRGREHPAEAAEDEGSGHGPEEVGRQVAGVVAGAELVPRLVPFIDDPGGGDEHDHGEMDDIPSEAGGLAE